jgi:hypothetical protein
MCAGSGERSERKARDGSSADPSASPASTFGALTGVAGGGAICSFSGPSGSEGVGAGSASGGSEGAGAGSGCGGSEGVGAGSASGGSVGAGAGSGCGGSEGVGAGSASGGSVGAGSGGSGGGGSTSGGSTSGGGGGDSGSGASDASHGSAATAVTCELASAPAASATWVKRNASPRIRAAPRRRSFGVTGFNPRPADSASRAGVVMSDRLDDSRVIAMTQQHVGAARTCQLQRAQIGAALTPRMHAGGMQVQPFGMSSRSPTAGCRDRASPALAVDRLRRRSHCGCGHSGDRHSGNIDW